MSELDNDELIATRKLNGLEDNLFRDGNDINVGSMTEEAFNELIDNFEVVEHLTPYGRKGIKENVKKLQARIKELEEPKIIQDKNIRSGKPIIKGTRLTIVDILLLITNFIKDYEKEFRENYADISLKQIIDSINYLLDNSIPKQKLKDKLEELKKEYIKELENNSTKAFILKCQITILEEIWEDK